MRVGAALMALLLAGSASAVQAPATASVRGSVVRSDGSPAGDVVVRLEVMDTERVVFQAEGRTDSAGGVVWNDVQVPGPSLARMAADFGGATYLSDAVPLGAGEEVVLLATVAEVTSEGRPLHLDTLHVIVQVDQPGIYSVLQFMTVSNAGNAAWAGGPELADGRRAGLAVPLPIGATDVRPAPFPTTSDSLPAGEMQIDADRVLDPRPVPPSGRQVAVTYALTASEEPLEVVLAVPYPAQSVSVLLGGPAAQGIEVRDTNLSRQEAERIGEQEYQLWTAAALPPDTEVRFTLALPSAGMSVASMALVALGIALLTAAAATLRGNALPANAAARLDGLVHEIALLDDEHATGRLDTAEYFVRRAAALEEALLLSDSLERVAGEAAQADDRPGG